MMKFFCRLGIHRWVRLPDVVTYPGFGVERFERWRCRRCQHVAERPIGSASL